VSDGTHTASIALLGNYSLANFTASSDGHGGTSVVDPPLSPAPNSMMPPDSTMPMACSGGESADWLSALDQRLALWSQQIASAFPSSSFGNGVTSPAGASEFGTAHLSQLAQPVATQQHT
jgi:hypothetical protein